MAASAIEFEGVRFAYPGGPEVLRGAAGGAPAGAFTVMIGPNGSGKSTLLWTLAGLLRPSAGTVRVAGVDPARAAPKERARRIGLLPQDDHPGAPFTVRELALLSRFARQGRSPFDRPEDEAAVDLALADVGMTHLAARLPSELSGGERQRAAFARALAAAPDVLLLDEPASMLDPRHQIETYELVRRVTRERGATVVVVSHDLNLAAAYAEVAWVLKDGAVVASGAPKDVLRASVLAPVFDVTFDEAAVEGRPAPLLFPRVR
jgi:iron complex transport system ATP-binding protein